MNLKICGIPSGIIAGSILSGVIALFFGSIIAFPAAAAGLNGDEAYSKGPQVCGKCHKEQFNDWLAHGHSRKLGIGGRALKKLDGKYGLHGNARDGGFRLPKHDTDVYNWKNILFIIGASKHWKTRFVGLDGFIITKNGANQYNWYDGSFSDYHKDEEKPYSCGSCHTTGYNKEGTVFSEKGFPGATKKGSPGIVGDWAHFNVTCEACHGPAQAHAKKPKKNKPVIDTSAEQCGTCHVRGSDPNTIIAKGGFIRHHEQYPEFANSPHKELTCVTCHKPHESRGQGTKVAEGNATVCETCHEDQKAAFTGSSMQTAGVTCIDCHMARATKSAVAVGPYEGDVKTHVMRINPAADYVMFTPDGKAAQNAISLEFACFRCHADADKAAYAKLGDFHTIGK
jgi:predicted CXXCH cytochrome family protein